MGIPARSPSPAPRRRPAPQPEPGRRTAANRARTAPAGSPARSRRQAPAAPGARRTGPSTARAPQAATARANATLRAVRDGARAEAAARRALPVHDVDPSPSSRRGARPRLVVVPRRRATARLAATAFAIVFLLMLAVVAFQTQLAQNQLELDRVEQQLDIERARTRELRRDNAALRSPDRIAAQAQSLGLVPTGSRQFIQIPADIVALVTVSAGGALDEVLTRETDAFRDYQETKHLVAGKTP